MGRNFVNTILNLAKENEEIRVVNDQIGCPTYARDLAYNIRKLISSNDYGIYHASGEGECSWYDFALQIVELGGNDVRVVPITSSEISRPALRPHYSALSNSRLGNLGMTMRSWQNALKDFFSKHNFKKN